MQFTVAEAVPLLHPAVSERRLRAIIAALPWFPAAGVRRDGTPGRPLPVYNWADLVRLHAAIAPWLDNQQG